MSISKSVSNALALVLASIGCLVALVLLYEHIHPSAEIGCSAVGGDCSSTIESHYGHLGPIPTSVFGLLMYATLVGLCIQRRKLIANERPIWPGNIPGPDADIDIDPLDPDTEVSSVGANTPLPIERAPNKQLWVLNLLIWLIATSAVCISMWLQKVALYELLTFCPWCMASAMLVSCIFLLASKDLFLEDRRLVGEQKLLAGTIGFIAVMGLLMVVPDILHQIDVIRKQHEMTPKPGPVPPIADLPIITKDMEITGPANAPYMIVEFADYECPHCQKTCIALSELLKDHPDKYRLAFRNYPLPNHKWATQAAIAAEAAGLQGKFWQMHDYIFTHQDDMKATDFGQEKFKMYAAALEMDVAKFETDETNDTIITRVATDSATSQKLKIALTPTFFIFNRAGRIFRLSGLEQLKAALDNPNNEAWK